MFETIILTILFITLFGFIALLLWDRHSQMDEADYQLAKIQLDRVNQRQDLLRHQRAQENHQRELLLSEFKAWAVTNINYTTDDILYYFSEFTDLCEYDYQVQSNLNLPEGVVDFTFRFVGPSYDCSTEALKLASTIRMNDDLKPFQIGWHQFISLEENLQAMKVQLSTQGDERRIHPIIEVKFKKLIPGEKLAELKLITHADYLGPRGDIGPRGDQIYLPRRHDF